MGVQPKTEVVFIFSEWHINHSEEITTLVFMGAHFVASGKDRTESDAQAQCIRETQGPWPKCTLGLIQNPGSKNLSPHFRQCREDRLQVLGPRVPEASLKSQRAKT